MKQPIENSMPMVKAAKRLGFRSLGVLLVIALLGLAAQAETFSFQLVKAPIALNPLNPTSESIRLSGGGTFDPALGAVAASGTFTLFNAFDHPNGPTVNGTWHATGFVSFTPLGSSEDEEAASAAVAELVAAGAARRTAAEVVSRLSGTPRNRLYRGSL